MQTHANCLGAQGVVQWGTLRQGRATSTRMTVESLQAHHRFRCPRTGQTPTFYAATVDPSCVTGAQRDAFKVGHVATHRTATAALR
jgi:hypothetical protein